MTFILEIKDFVNLTDLMTALGLPIMHYYIYLQGLITILATFQLDYTSVLDLKKERDLTLSDIEREFNFLINLNYKSLYLYLFLLNQDTSIEQRSINYFVFFKLHARKIDTSKNQLYSKFY